MQQEVKNKYSSVMIEKLQETIMAIESLEEYYLNSIKNVQLMKINIEEQYEIGLIIDNKLKEYIALGDMKNIRNKISELLETKLANGIKISEYISIECDGEEDDLTISYSINSDSKLGDKYIDPKTARREYDKIEQYENILISSTLSTIVIIFEQFLAKIYEGLILLNPKKYFEDKKIEISNIFNKNVNEIVGECVKREVESNMFDSINTLELISQKEKIDINRYVNIQDDFEEIYYRRNLYIHNNGIVNNIYLSNVKEKYRGKYEVGKKLITDDIYLRNAIDMLYKIVCTFFYEVQLTFNPTYDKWNTCLSNIAFDLLHEKNYVVAEQIYFIMSSCKAFCFRDKAMYRINYINSLKQQGKMDKVKKEINELDVSIATDEFKIAKMCLEDRNEEVYAELSKNYPDPFSAELIRDWPIFINFRETEYYTKFVNEHQADFGLFIFEFDEKTKENEKIDDMQ